MYHNLVKWLHYMWLFPNIWDILVKLHLLCSIFQRVRKSWLNMCALQTLYGINVGKLGSPSTDLQGGPWEISQVFLALLLDDVLHSVFCWDIPKILGNFYQNTYICSHLV